MKIVCLNKAIEVCRIKIFFCDYNLKNLVLSFFFLKNFYSLAKLYRNKIKKLIERIDNGHYKIKTKDSLKKIK